jgi:two-component system, OmpR family, alkaline phosphatase synthesis response regulator PhoP
MLARVLLVEDEEHLQTTIKMNLEMDGYEVVAVGNGVDALKKFRDQRFNLVILDIMLPELDGYEVCEQIRLDDYNLPILFLTAKDGSQDIVKGLKKGADDYLTKPFNLEELMLRVRNLVKRSMSEKEKEEVIQTYEFGGNRVNFVTYEAETRVGHVVLTKKELKLLKLLIDKKNEVVSRQQILQSVWGYDVFPSTRTIDNFILSYRKYFEEDPKNPRYFHSIRGVGYKFTP